MGDSLMPSVPLGITEPPDVSVMAGSSAQSLPANSDSSGGIGSLASQLNVIPIAPTAPQYTAAPSPAMQPHVRVPSNAPMRDTNRQPLSNQATSLKQARRQNRFAEISNVINQYTQHEEQQKMADLKTDITNLTRAQTQVANAQQVLQDKNATPEAKTAAQTVLKTNTDYINGLLKDPKKRKEISKAFDISFTDPSQNNTPEVKAGQAALKDAQANAKAGLDTNTPAEKAVADHLNKPAETQSYAEQFMAKQPQQLTANPIYEQQLKQFTDQQKYASQYIIPKIIDQQTRELTTHILADAKLADRYAQNKEKIYEAQLKAVTDLQKSNVTAQAHLKGIAMQNAERAQAAQLRAQTALQIAGMKDSKGTWKEQAFQDKALQSFTTEIDSTSKTNKGLFDANNAIRTKYGKNIPADQQQLIDNNEKQIKMNNLFINQMTDNRQKMTTRIYGTPVATAPTSTDDVTKGYLDERSRAKPSNGPADDSAAATESNYLNSPDWAQRQLQYLEQEDELDPDDENTEFN